MRCAPNPTPLNPKPTPMFQPLSVSLQHESDHNKTLVAEVPPGKVSEEACNLSDPYGLSETSGFKIPSSHMLEALPPAALVGALEHALDHCDVDKRLYARTCLNPRHRKEGPFGGGGGGGWREGTLIVCGWVSPENNPKPERCSTLGAGLGGQPHPTSQRGYPKTKGS